MNYDNLDETADFVILYLQARNAQNWGFVGYKQFKALISYILNIKDINTLRTIFERIISLGTIEKRKVGSSTEYRFIF
jgi:hypothetical protein